VTVLRVCHREGLSQLNLGAERSGSSSPSRATGLGSSRMPVGSCEGTRWHRTGEHTELFHGKQPPAFSAQ